MPNLMPRLIALTAQWIVVSKPAGMLTIPGRNLSHEVPILIDWVRKEYTEAWVTHRLDIETSGVVLFARTAADHQRANGWFGERKIKKAYFCLASGRPVAPLFKVNAPINGALSMTQVEVRENYQEGFLARVVPRTGRRHQIRIHLSKSGYPLWGDPTYGGSREVILGGESLSVNRVALHAYSLELPSGEKFEDPFPEDFTHWLDQLRTRGNHV